MDLGPYVESLGRELGIAAEAAGPQVQAQLERVVVQLESAIRLTMLEVLSGAADEITRELLPGSVHVRLQGRDPAFVVDAPRARDAAPEPVPAAPVSPASSASVATDDDGGTTRINLRLPDHLKIAMDAAAAAEHLSANAWLVRAVASAVGAGSPTAHALPSRVTTRKSGPGQRFTGWVS